MTPDYESVRMQFTHMPSTVDFEPSAVPGGAVALGLGSLKAVLAAFFRDPYGLNRFLALVAGVPAAS